MVTEYSSASKWFHWLIAVVVISLLSLSFFLKDLPDKYIGTAFLIHKSLGLTVLFLAMLRIIWIVRCGRPSLPNGMPFWERVFSRVVQLSFYFLLIIMPLSGWIMSVASKHIPSFFGLFYLPLPIEPSKPLATFMDNTHVTIAWIFISLIILHVAGALKHHFYNKDDVLRKMLFIRK